MVHKMQQTSVTVRALKPEGAAEAACAAYADDGAAFGWGALEWRKNWKGDLRRRATSSRAPA
jgi:hypothetical protein